MEFFKETDRADLQKYIEHLCQNYLVKGPRGYIFQLVDIPREDWNQYADRSYTEGDTVDVDLSFTCWPNYKNAKTVEDRVSVEYEIEFEFSEYVLIQNDRILHSCTRELLTWEPQHQSRKNAFFQRLIDLVYKYQTWCGDEISGDLARFYGYFAGWRAEQIIDTKA